MTLAGPLGDWKKTIGKVLAKKLDYKFYDVDHIIEGRCGANIAWIYDLDGPEGFQKREEKVIDEYTLKNKLVLATGGGAVFSALSRDYLTSRGYVVYLSASLDRLLQRTEFDRKRPQLQTEEKDLVMEKLLLESIPLYQSIANLTVRTDQMPVAKIINTIVEAISYPD